MIDPSYTNSGTPIGLAALSFHELPKYEPVGDVLDSRTVWRVKPPVIRVDNYGWLFRPDAPRRGWWK